MTVPQPGDIGFERPRFFDGERLTAADLFAAQSYERELRWLHNRTLHPWGVARGLSVSGARGDRTLTVGAGYALDCLGRDLIVPADTVMQVPPVPSGRYRLTASYVDDDGLPPVERTGVCGTSGAVRLPERCLLRFQSRRSELRSALYRRGRDVVLAEIKVSNCALAEAADTSTRDDAAVDRPYVGAGLTEPGGTTWVLWPDFANPVGVATTVPTAAAAFAVVPAYQASVIGTRTFTNASGQQLIADGPVTISDAALTSFEVHVDLAPYGVLNPDDVRNSAFPERLSTDLGWYVSWIGIEV
jgi:hypothetical protein